ncbi:MAG: hypothetical protein Q7J34_06670 [Bacteroidales bacterium]|jgi:hypothetical protein|nr:hypothetical protein [Bacteroidales bacterium]
MKFLLPAFFAIFLSLIVPRQGFAQSNSRYISIRSGLSLPMMDYSSYSLDEGCFTSIGFNVSADATWYFYKGFGIEFSGGLNLHPVEVGVLGYEIVVNDPFMSDTYIRSEPYKVLTAMAGPAYHFQIYDKLSISTKLLFGVAEAKTPHQIHKPVYLPLGPEIYEVGSSIDRQFSWIAGAGVRYDITNCYGLIFNTEMTSRKFGFGFNTPTGIRTDYKVISFINFTLGVQFNL